MAAAEEATGVGVAVCQAAGRVQLGVRGVCRPLTLPTGVFRVRRHRTYATWKPIRVPGFHIGPDVVKY